MSRSIDFATGLKASLAVQEGFRHVDAAYNDRP